MAAKVFRLAQADPQIGQSFAKRNWVSAWERDRASVAAMGVPLAVPALRYELIPAAAKSFGRAVAFVQWQASNRVPAPPACNATSAPSYKPSEAVANLFDNFNAPLTSLGSHHQFTPLSAHGPGCSGSIPSRCNLPAQRLGPIGWARVGAAAMRSPLFSLDTDAPASTFEAESLPCRLCGVSPIDPYHLIAECNHTSIDAWRQRAEEAARELLVTLTVLLTRERNRAGREPDDWLFRRIRRAAADLDFETSEGYFVLYRLLLAQPWPESMATPGMRLARLLGRAFDLPGIYHRFERPVLDTWSRWSLHWLRALSLAWRSAAGGD